VGPIEIVAAAGTVVASGIAIYEFCQRRGRRVDLSVVPTSNLGEPVKVDLVNVGQASAHGCLATVSWEGFDGRVVRALSACEVLEPSATLPLYVPASLSCFNRTRTYSELAEDFVRVVVDIEINRGHRLHSRVQSRIALGLTALGSTKVPTVVDYEAC